MATWSPAALVLVCFVGLSQGSPVSTPNEKCNRYLYTVSGRHYVPAETGCDMEKSTQVDRRKRDLPSPAKAGDEGMDIAGIMESVSAVVEAMLNPDSTAKSNVTCATCTKAIEALRYLVGMGTTEQEVVQTATAACIVMKIMPYEICKNLVRMNAPQLMYILNNTMAAEPLTLCSFLVPPVCGKVNATEHLWRVQLPEKNPNITESTRKPVEGAPTLKVIHISDTHIDSMYTEGSWAECNLPLCCRNGEGGEPTANATKAGKWGGWKCDIPARTFESMMAHIAQEHGDVDYIIWTGDVPSHDSWHQDRNMSLAVLRDTVQLLFNFTRSVPVYPTVGNHEASPANQFPTRAMGEPWDVDWLYRELDQQWSRWLPETVSEQLQKSAAYTVLVRPGLRLVSLNTNMCYYNNWWLMLNSTDPLHELQWLVSVLHQAEERQEKVHIIGHISPTSRDCIWVWQENFFRILERYCDTVVAQYYGHSHYDEVNMLFDQSNSSRVVGLSYIGGSATTYTYLQPSYRVYIIDGDHPDTTSSVLDFTTWYMDLERANAEGTPNWEKLYSAREAYGLQGLTNDDWHDFYTRLATDEELQQLFYKHMWKDSPKRPLCDDACRATMVCDVATCTRLDNNLSNAPPVTAS